MSDPFRDGKLHHYVHQQTHLKVESVHMWGFFDESGGRSLPEASVSDLSVYQHLKRVQDNITRHGGEVENLWTTRDLGPGWLIRVEFEVPAQEGADRMWHRISTPREEWPA